MEDQYIFDRITVNPDRCNGKPTIRGMRITVSTILEFLGAGDSIQTILEAYDFLEEEDILACIRYASEILKAPRVIVKV